MLFRCFTSRVCFELSYGRWHVPLDCSCGTKETYGISELHYRMVHRIRLQVPLRRRWKGVMLTIFTGIFTTASTTLIYAQTLGALIALYRPHFTLQAWQTFVIYQGLNVLTAAVVMFGNRIVPALNRFSLFYLQIGWIVVLVTVVACAPSYQDPKFVFATWINNTGWGNQVICFITGLVNPLYSLGGLDGITHITEEMPNVSHRWPSVTITNDLLIPFSLPVMHLLP